MGYQGPITKLWIKSGNTGKTTVTLVDGSACAQCVTMPFSFNRFIGNNTFISAY